MCFPNTPFLFAYTIILLASPMGKKEEEQKEIKVLFSRTGKIQGLTGRESKEGRGGHNTGNTVTTNLAKQPLPGRSSMIFHQGKRTLHEMSGQTLTVTG